MTDLLTIQMIQETPNSVNGYDVPEVYKRVR
jgi:hypothetical protein